MIKTELQPLLATLLSAQNADGGWGYSPGKESRPEPSAWMYIALEGIPSAEETRHTRVQSWLTGQLQSDGRVISTPTTDVSTWTTPLVAFALLEQNIRADVPAALRALASVLALKSRVISPPLPNNPTGDQPAWGWTTNAFSWIEPTSYAVWALRRASRWPSPIQPEETKRRLEAAKRVLLGRRCADLGWNYGSALASEYQLDSFPVPTALGILSLLALDEKEEALKAWPVLLRRLQEEPSALSRAWTIIAGKVLGQSTAELEAPLLAGWNRLSSQHNLAGALTLIALGETWKRWS